MMTQIIAPALLAGAASALLFASVVSGLGISVVLMCLAPLPVMIVAMGWSHRAGWFAALSGATLVCVALNPTLAALFFLFAGFPSWLLGTAALLGRPVAAADGAPPRIEWFPTGWLLLGAAVFGAAGLALPLIYIEGNQAALLQDLRTLADTLQHATDLPGAPSVPPEMSAIDPDLMVTVVLRTVLPLTAVLMSAALVFDLWIAARVVRISDRLQRPLPDLADVTLPPFAAALWVAALVAAFVVPDLPGIAGVLLASTLTTAFAVTGFALLHTLTRGNPNRLWILGGAYLAVGLLGLPLLVMAAMGIADTLFGLRGVIKPGGDTPPPVAKK